MRSIALSMVLASVVLAAGAKEKRPIDYPSQWGDSIDGTPASETIDLLAGDDQGFGFGGDDIIDGGPGHDVIDGMEGNDTVRGGDGNDRLWGSEGNDTLDGGPGNDSLMGGAGDDRLLGGDGDDQLTGSAGNNLAEGGPGNDTYIVSTSMAEKAGTLRVRDGGSNEVWFRRLWTPESITVESEDADLIVRIPIRMSVGQDVDTLVIVEGGAQGTIDAYRFGTVTLSRQEMIGRVGN